MSDQERKIENFLENKENLERYVGEILSLLPLALCFLNLEGVITKVNGKTEELTGFNVEELSGEDLGKIFSQKRKEKILKEERFIGEAKLKRKDGRMPVLIFSKKSGEEILLGFIDLSRVKEGDREESKRRMIESEKKLEEKIRELEQFNRLATGRELKMIELKREKAQLEKEIKRLKSLSD